MLVNRMKERDALGSVNFFSFGARLEKNRIQLKKWKDQNDDYRRGNELGDG